MALAAFRKAETAEAQVLILGNMHARWICWPTRLLRPHRLGRRRACNRMV